jgi:uncharacterized protein YjbI with pentapeptide repeats
VEVRARVVDQVPVNPDDHLTFEQADLHDRDLSGRTLVSFTSIGSRFERCRFEKLRVRQAALGAGTEVSQFIDCSFDGSRLTMGSGGFARYVRCSFRGVDLRDWDADTVDLVDCVFTGKLRTVTFWGAQLTQLARNRYEAHARFREKERLGPPPDAVRELMLRESNEITGNDFTGADLIKVNFRGGLDLTAQRLPAGADYLYLPDARGAIDRALADLDAHVPDAAMRPKVASFLTSVLGRELDMGQRQLLLRESDFMPAGSPKPAIAAAFALLRAG